MGGRRYNRFLHEINTWVFDKRHSEEVESMPNIKSAKKRVLLSREANVKNKMAKSALKTTLKNSAVVAGNREEATAAYKAAVVAVDKAAVKGILHKNNAARKKSSMTLKLNAMA